MCCPCIAPAHAASNAGPNSRKTAGWPLYRPPYPLVETDPLLIVEGEQCADDWAKLGISAVTSGGAQSADTADWSSVHGSESAMWPDNDKDTCLDYAQAVLAKLPGTRLIHSDIVQTLPPKGDCADWLVQHPDATADTVRALEMVESEASHADIRIIEPEPLRRPLPPAAPYPVETLCEVLGNAVQRIRAVVQAPAALCGNR